MEDWKNTYCSKSWTDVNVDFSLEFVKNCCKSQPIKFTPNIDKNFFEFNADLLKRKKDSLEGIKNHDCQFCWNEDNKRVTYRDLHNRWTPDFVENNKKDLLSGKKSFANYVEVKFSNKCDMACIYCSPKFSSKIAIEENLRLKSVPLSYEFEAFKDFSDPLIKNAIEMDRSKISKEAWDTTQLRFVFLGGEPTLIDQFYDFIDFIKLRIAYHSNEQKWQYLMRNVRLEIVTNCNTVPSLMEKFFKLVESTNFEWTIGISNESYGKDAELIRHGLNWERFQSNFRRYISTSKKIDSINLAPTLNIFSLKTFHFYMSWVHEQFRKQLEQTGWCPAFTWHGNYVADPVLDIKVLPADFKKYIDAAIDVAEKETNPKFKNKQSTLKFLSQMKDRIGSADPKSQQSVLFKERAKDWILAKENKKNVSNLRTLLDNIDYHDYDKD